MKVKADASIPHPTAVAVARRAAPAARAAAESRSAPELWVLLGRRRGDNLQMLALAEVIGIPFRAIQLRFNTASALPNVLLGASRLSSACDVVLGPPWPAAVISSGRRAVPLAAWIQRESGGTTRLIHVGRPWAPLSWFDLIVTTPQYQLPARANVLHNSMPLSTPQRLGAADDPAGIRPLLERLPRPHVAVFPGGNARPYRFDQLAARRLACRALELAAGSGSVIAVAGPRTPPDAVAALRAALPSSALVFPWNADANPYATVRADADRFLVTIDSAAVLSELITVGRPVDIFPLPVNRDLRLRFSGWLEEGAERHPALQRLRMALISAGLLTSVRDLGCYVDALRREGLLADGELARVRQRAELQRAASRARRAIIAGR